MRRRRNRRGPMMRRMVLWFDDRLGAATFARRALRKAFPDHWSFMIGEIALYCFVLLVLTGIFLSFFYAASPREVVYRGPYEPLRGETMSAAYESVLRISFEVRAGMVMRQIHHWAAVVFLAAISVHILRVFFTGAFRRPREINWIVGVTMLLLALGAGFTGYSLPDDLLSGTGVRIAYSVLLSVPLIGTWAAFLAFGGEFPSFELLGRLYAMHIFLLPAALAALISVHLALIWHQKHTQFRAPGRREDNVVGSPLWPNYAMRSLGLMFMVFAVLALLAGVFQINPVWMYGPFDPTTVSSPAQPDWYLGWIEGALRLAPNWEVRLFGYTIPEPFVPGVLLPSVFFLMMYLWPFIERRLTGDDEEHHLLDRPRDNPLRTGIGVGILTFTVVLTLAGSNDVLGSFFRIPVENVTRALRVLVFLLPPLFAWIAFRVARDLRDREVHMGKRVTLVRTASGGFEELSSEVPAGDGQSAERDEAALRAERRAGRAERRARRALRKAEREVRKAKREERRAATERESVEEPPEEGPR
jgi:ubiquinol-cytochrome c reductase cytochrome b subunit